MNTTQIQTTLAPLVAFAAGLLAGKGVFGWDAATWTTIIGGVLGLGAAIWGAISASKANIITTAANQPEVQSIKLASSASSDLVAATPSNVQK